MVWLRLTFKFYFIILFDGIGIYFLEIMLLCANALSESDKASLVDCRL